MTMSGTALNMSAWLATNIIIWVPTTSGWSWTRPAWRVFAAGKEIMLTGACTPFAMKNTAVMHTGTTCRYAACMPHPMLIQRRVPTTGMMRPATILRTITTIIE